MAFSVISTPTAITLLLIIFALKSFFGKDENFLREHFYTISQEQTFFGEIEKIKKVDDKKSSGTLNMDILTRNGFL